MPLDALVRKTIVCAAYFQVWRHLPDSITDVEEGTSSTVIRAGSDAVDVRGGDGFNLEGPMIYSSARPQPISLNIIGLGFEGFDFNSDSHFSGVLRPGEVHLSDLETGRGHVYGVAKSSTPPPRLSP